MKTTLNYKIRGLTYWARCLNPFRDTVYCDGLPLGLQMRGYKRDAVGRGIYRRKLHERGVTEFLLARFPKGGDYNFIDVGANIGYFSLLMSRLAGAKGRVLAFEPEPQNQRLLQENIRLNSLTNVAIHSCALGAQAGTATLGLYKHSNRGRHSILNTNANSNIDVSVRTLYEVSQTDGADVSRWSLIKIDVEGYEGFVIEGAQAMLPQVDAIVMEFSPAASRAAGKSPASTLDILASNFSTMHRLENSGLTKVTARECCATEAQMDLVFTRD